MLFLGVISEKKMQFPGNEQKTTKIRFTNKYLENSMFFVECGLTGYPLYEQKLL